MLEVTQYVVVAVLSVSAATKLLAPSSRTRLVVFGVVRPAAQWLAWGGLISVEATLAMAIVAGDDLALLVASVLFGSFALLHYRLVRRGESGQACGCFGARGTVSWTAVAQNAALSGVAAVGFLGVRGQLAERDVLGIAVVVLAVVVIGLAAAVLALAREIGVLRIAMQSTGALEIADEGPAVGTLLETSQWVEAQGQDFVLAVFVSDGCPMCQSLGPSLDLIRGDPRIAVLVFDEERDQDAWREFRSPGAPYAVALDPDGLVLAKGVANSLPQLESVIATAARRREAPIHV